MPRPPRISLADALYYITSRCIYNQDIFKEASDYNAYFELLKKYKEQYKFKLYAYALLPTHFHLLLELPDQQQEEIKGGISEIMHGLNSSYTKYFNGKYGRKGHLFRGRFKTALVEKDPYLLKLTAYVHLNPQKLNLSSGPAEYPYTSYSLYINKEMPLQKFMQEEKDIVLGLLGQKSYEQFMQEIVKAGGLSLHNDLQKKGILGGLEFRNRVTAKFVDKESKLEDKAGDNGIREPLKRPGLKVGTTVLVVALVGLGLTLIAKFTLRENKSSIPERSGAVAVNENKADFFNLLDKAAVAVKPPVVQPVQHSKPKLQDVLEGTNWQITLTPASGGASESDTLTFSQKKFVSANLDQKKFAASNYSVRNGENGKIIWETMQTAPEGIAVWRADISPDGTMKGVLSLRKEGLAVQDFTFRGEYWKGK